MGDYGSDTYREQAGVVRPQSHTNDPGGVLQAENLLSASSFKDQTIGRYQREPDFTNQLTDHGLRQVRNDLSGPSLSSRVPQQGGVVAISSQTTQSPIRGAFVNTRSFRSSESITADSTSSSASSSPIPTTATSERTRRHLHPSRNVVQHPAEITYAHKAGNRLQSLGGLENQTGLGSPHFLASSTHNPTRFASNEPPYPDSRNISSPALPGTEQTSSSTSRPRGGDDTGLALPSLSSLTRDLPYHAQRLDVVTSRDPPRSSNIGSRDNFHSSSTKGPLPLDHSLILPPLRLASPNTPPLQKRQLDNAFSMEQGWPSSKRAPAGLGNLEVNRTESRQSYAAYSSTSLLDDSYRTGKQTASSSPRSEHLRLGTSFRHTSRPSTPNASGSRMFDSNPNKLLRC